MCNETTFRCHRIEALLLLYRTVFMQSLIFNSQAWSHITLSDLDELRKVQTRCLKRILWAPSSTSNAYVFLELAVLPVEYEIEIRQCMYLQHIIQLPDDHLIHRIYKQELCYHAENNWANNMEVIKAKYGFPKNDVISKMSRESWKNLVREKITEEARKLLLEKSQSMSKTKQLIYEDAKFETQKYLLSYPFHTASTIFKIRGRVINCLGNHGRKEPCRLCNTSTETQNHAVNCPGVVSERPPINIEDVYGDVDIEEEVVVEIAERVHLFENALKQKCDKESVSD